MMMMMKAGRHTTNMSEQWRVISHIEMLSLLECWGRCWSLVGPSAVGGSSASRHRHIRHHSEEVDATDRQLHCRTRCRWNCCRSAPSYDTYLTCSTAWHYRWWIDLQATYRPVFQKLTKFVGIFYKLRYWVFCFSGPTHSRSFWRRACSSYGHKTIHFLGSLLWNALPPDLYNVEHYTTQCQMVWYGIVEFNVPLDTV